MPHDSLKAIRCGDCLRVIFVNDILDDYCPECGVDIIHSQNPPRCPDPDCNQPLVYMGKQ